MSKGMVQVQFQQNPFPLTWKYFCCRCPIQTKNWPDSVNPGKGFWMIASSLQMTFTSAECIFQNVLNVFSKHVVCVFKTC